MKNGIKIQWLILLTGSFLINVSGSCKKLCLNGNRSTFQFEITVQAIHDRDSVAVGDTIWLEVDAPTTLKDVVSNKMVDYSGAGNLGSSIGFQKLNVSNFDIKAAKKFNLILEKGIETVNADAQLFHQYLFIEVNNRYVFRLGLTPKEKGIFRLVFSNANNVYRRIDKCTKAAFTINFENTNQHRYLDPNFEGSTAKGGDYNFKVY